MYHCAVDIAGTETKGTVRLGSAARLLSYSREEETVLGGKIAALAQAGVGVVVSSASFSDLAVHFMERHGMMGVKVGSRFELRRLCVAVEAVALARFTVPSPEELGRCDVVEQREIGGELVGGV